MLLACASGRGQRSRVQVKNECTHLGAKFISSSSYCLMAMTEKRKREAAKTSETSPAGTASETTPAAAEARAAAVKAAGKALKAALKTGGGEATPVAPDDEKTSARKAAKKAAKAVLKAGGGVPTSEASTNDENKSARKAKKKARKAAKQAALLTVNVRLIATRGGRGYVTAASSKSADIMQQRKFLTTEMISERSAEFHNYKVAVAGAELNVVSDPRGLAGGSCGSSLWAASESFVRWTKSTDEFSILVRSRSVLELGSGLGLVGQVAALLGARKVVLTDVPAQIPLLRCNVELNAQLHFLYANDDEPLLEAPVEGQPVVEVIEHSWGEGFASRLAQHARFDVVLGSDLLYTEESVAPLWSSIEAAVAPAGCVLLALPDRDEDIDDGVPTYRNQLFSLAQTAGFTVVRIFHEESSVIGTESDMDVFLMRRKVAAVVVDKKNYCDVDGGGGVVDDIDGVFTR